MDQDAIATPRRAGKTSVMREASVCPTPKNPPRVVAADADGIELAARDRDGMEETVRDGCEDTATVPITLTLDGIEATDTVPVIGRDTGLAPSEITCA
jgi:hypothetical protein